jgi:membrane-anchored protein YejM (alkaline phosphatase superfamily)
MIRVGTHHFESKAAARQQYGDVDHALTEGLIAIGQPEYDYAAGQRLFPDKSRRYHIGYPEAKDVRG